MTLTLKKRGRDSSARSRKARAAATPRQSNKKMDRDPERIMRLAEANTTRMIQIR